MYACLIALIGLFMLMDVARAHAATGINVSDAVGPGGYGPNYLTIDPVIWNSHQVMGSPPAYNGNIITSCALIDAGYRDFEGTSVLRNGSYPGTGSVQINFGPNSGGWDSGNYNTGIDASSLPDGDYVAIWNIQTYPSPFTCAGVSITHEAYANFTVSGGVPGPPTPPPPIGGDITILYPTNATTTASTTFPVVIGYTIADDLEDYSLDGSLPVRIGIELSYDDLYAPGGYTYLPVMWDIASSTGAHGTTTDITLPIESDYSLQAKLILDYGFIPSLEGCTPNPPFVTCAGSQSLAVYQWDEITFSAVNGAMGVIGFQPGGGPFGGGAGLATTTCNIANISGCFQNAIAFLFFPSPDALSTFSFLWENVKNKPPFGYVSQTISALNTISISGTASFEFGELPFMDEIFTPLKNGLEGLLWLSLIVGFLYRLRELDI